MTAKEEGLWSRGIQAQIPVPAFISCVTLGSQINCSVSHPPPPPADTETVASVAEPSEVEGGGTCRWSDPFLSSKSVFVSHKVQMEMTKPSPRHVASIPTPLRRVWW